ncbi:MAG: hypothetical protein QF645_05630 [Planctomycetota bacterium]|jgi:hypothetical protein|nr:hypothetical protein [Planctomycetota bacterium]
METKKIWVVLFLFGFVGSAIGLGLQAKKINRMERELEWVKKKLKSPAIAASLEKSIEVDGLDYHQEEVVLAPTPNDLPETTYSRNNATVPAEEYDPTVITPETLKELQGVVKDQVKEEMSKLKRKKKGEDISMKYLADELKLDTYAQERATLYYNECKDRGLELLCSPRADGGNFMDDFARAELTGEGGKEVWGRLFSDRIPGTDQTYFQRLVEISEETTQNIRTLFTQEQMDNYGSYEVDPFKVNTGYDPFENYIQERNNQ